jgi:hypothetical protein
VKVLLVALLVAGFGGSAAAFGTAAAKLAVPSTDPLTVRGTHFRANEKVKLVAEIGSRVTKRQVVADGSGAFRVRFELVVPASTHLSVTATGSRGSRAHYGVDYGDAVPSAK